MPDEITHIDEEKLETDLAYRFDYVSSFIGLTEEDIHVILGAKELLAPIVPALVDAVYAKLFQYDATKRHFVPRQSGYEGDAPIDLNSLTLDHEQIKFRKAQLTKYLVRLVSGPYDGKLVSYLDRVGAIHTSDVGSEDLYVPLVQMNALMGFVADAVNATIMGLEIPQDAKNKAIRAFGKLLWIQNDLITRHYQKGVPVSTLAMMGQQSG